MRAYTISLVILILCSCNDGSQSGGSGDDFLTTTTDEPEGANCTWGGSFVESGLDNGDGDGIEDNNVLEDGEVDTSEYDCDVIGVAPYQLEASAFTLDGPGIAATQVCESKGLVLATWSSESELDALIQTCHLGEFDNPCFTQYQYALKHPIPIGANLSLSMGVAGEDS